MSLLPIPGSNINQSNSVQNVDTIKSEKTNSKSQIKDVIYVGVGPSIAAYLKTVDDKSSFKNTAIIGKLDNWSPDVRGAGKFNHQMGLISLDHTQIPEQTREVAYRQEIVLQNQRTIDEAVQHQAQRIHSNVSSIIQENTGLFKVTCQDENGNEKVLLGKKIVVGVGAGPHTKVGESENPNATHAEKQLHNIKIHKSITTNTRTEKILDLDAFMRLSDNYPEMFKDKTIAIHGPNAGIDAVERAGELDAKVVWLGRSTLPVILDGNNLKYAPQAAKNDFKKIDTLIIKNGVNDSNADLRLEYTLFGGDGNTETIDADYYVYALGQDVEKGLGKFMPKDLVEYLEPVYDINQLYGSPEKTVLAFQTVGSTVDSGITIIGAAVEQLANDKKIDANFSNRDTGNIIKKQVNNQTSTEVASVVTSSQLRTVQGSIYAANSYIRETAKKGVLDLSTGNINELRIAIAVKYQDAIPENLCQEFIGNLLKIRTLSTKEFTQLVSSKFPGSTPTSYPVHGFNKDVSKSYDKLLSELTKDKNTAFDLLQAMLEPFTNTMTPLDDLTKKSG